MTYPDQKTHVSFDTGASEEVLMTDLYEAEIDFSGDYEDVPLQNGKYDIRLSQAPGMRVTFRCSAASYTQINNLSQKIGLKKTLDLSGLLGNPAVYTTMFEYVMINRLEFIRFLSGAYEFIVSFVQDTSNQAGWY